MIHQGTDLKFRITVTDEKVSLTEDQFSIRIRDIYGRVRYAIEKENCLWDASGNAYFVMDNVRRGQYFACFAIDKDDLDFPDGAQRITDIQPLVVVGMCDWGIIRHSFPCSTDGLDVTYERVWTVNIEGDVYLADKDGNPILDSDGNKIRLTGGDGQRAGVKLDMTGEEFKTLVERRVEDGKVNTIPELIDVMTGIGDTNDILGGLTDEDIEQWFENNSEEQEEPEEPENPE